MPLTHFHIHRRLARVHWGGPGSAHRRVRPLWHLPTDDCFTSADFCQARWNSRSAPPCVDELNTTDNKKTSPIDSQISFEIRPHLPTRPATFWRTSSFKPDSFVCVAWFMNEAGGYPSLAPRTSVAPISPSLASSHIPFYGFFKERTRSQHLQLASPSKSARTEWLAHWVELVCGQLTGKKKQTFCTTMACRGRRAGVSSAGEHRGHSFAS